MCVSIYFRWVLLITGKDWWSCCLISPALGSHPITETSTLDWDFTIILLFLVRLWAHWGPEVVFLLIFLQYFAERVWHQIGVQNMFTTKERCMIAPYIKFPSLSKSLPNFLNVFIPTRILFKEKKPRVSDCIALKTKSWCYSPPPAPIGGLISISFGRDYLQNTFTRSSHIPAKWGRQEWLLASSFHRWEHWPN